MRVVWLQAVEFESLGTIERWLWAKGNQVRRVALWQGEPLPEVATFDALIHMGGAFVPTDLKHYPWLDAATALLRSAVQSERKVLGVCLGAQLLGRAFGSTIRSNIHREIGWHMVERVSSGEGHPLAQDLPNYFQAFHWHQDTVDLPEGGTLLASSRATLNQAFALGRHALGIQFHPEIDEAKASIFSRQSASDRSGPYEQKDETIMLASRSFAQQRVLIAQLLENLFRV